MKSPQFNNTEDKPKRMRMTRSSSLVAECLQDFSRADLFHWERILKQKMHSIYFLLAKTLEILIYMGMLLNSTELTIHNTHAIHY
jgi:hypothetical protein